MSNHLIDCAAETDLPASKKLALMACADSADRDSHIALPGLDMIMRWSGLGKSRALEVIAELCDEGYLRRVSAARRGHRAEFLVFAAIECCAMHEPADGNGSAQPDPKLGSARPDPNPKGSARPDPKRANGSDKGSDKGSDSYRTPSFASCTSKSNPSLDADASTGGEGTVIPMFDTEVVEAEVVEDEPPRVTAQDLVKAAVDDLALPRWAVKRFAARAKQLLEFYPPDEILAGARLWIARNCRGDVASYVDEAKRGTTAPPKPNGYSARQDENMRRLREHAAREGIAL